MNFIDCISCQYGLEINDIFFDLYDGTYISLLYDFKLVTNKNTENPKKLLYLK